MSGLRWVPGKGVVWQSDIQEHIRAHNPFTPDARAFRFYFDGTESGSSPRGAEGANIQMDPSSDTQFQLRVSIQETGGDTSSGNNNWTLEYELNDSGTWITCNSSGSAVQNDSGSSLTNNADTTNRSTDGISDPGTGTFDAGQQDTDNGVSVSTLTSGDFTETVWGSILIPAGLSVNDTVDFRVTLAGTTFAATMGQPRITIIAGDTSPQEALSANQHLNHFYYPNPRGLLLPSGEYVRKQERDGT